MTRNSANILIALIVFTLASLCAGCSSAQKKLAACETDHLLDYSIQLADSPYPGAHPLAHTPWMIVYGPEPYGMALVNQERILATGETDTNGDIILSMEQRRRITNIVCNTDENIWLMHPGTIALINSVILSDDWSDNEKLFHLLKAADLLSSYDDYSDELFSQDEFKATLESVKRSFGVSTNAELIEALDNELSIEQNSSDDDYKDASTDPDQSSVHDINQLYREFGADGALVALGDVCNQPNNVIDKLLTKLEDDSMMLARNSHIAFDKMIYQKYFNEGYERTYKLILAIQPSPTSKQKNCMEVDAKIRSRIGIQ